MSELRYSLRKGVRIIDKKPRAFLCSSFPLKAVALNERQRAFLRSLEACPGQGLDDIYQGFFPGQSKDRLESYLDRLVMAGFLQQRGIRADLPFPAVSIIIPVRNRPKDIGRCIESLLALDYPRDRMEIVVVDDASIDETLEVVRRYPVIARRQTTNQGASGSRNLGAKDAKGELLFFIDSDCAVAPETLRELAAAFRNPAVGACGGQVESMEERSGLDRYEQVKSSLKMGSVRKDSAGGDPFFYVPSCGMAVRKEAFARVGGFNVELKVGEDVDLCWRLIDRGYLVDYRPSARIYHRHRNTLGQFCRRRFDYGTSEPILQKLHANRRKTFRVWPGSALFWAILVAALILKSAALGLSALGWLAGDAFLRRRSARKAGLSLGYGAPLQATARTHLSFLYHVFSFFSRYYLIPTLPLAFLSPTAAGAIWVAHCVTGVVQFFVTKPNMNPVSFLIYFSFEQLSYQAGVWYECFRLNAYAPIYPKVCFKRP